jgi:hypothetical protein
MGIKEVEYTCEIKTGNNNPIHFIVIFVTIMMPFSVESKIEL